MTGPLWNRWPETAVEFAVKAWLIVATALLTTVCTAGQSGPRPSSRSPSPFVRGCDSAVFGDVNGKNATRIGPLLLVGIAEAAHLPPRAFRRRHGRYSAVKVLAVVTGSSDVTLTVPPSERASVSLLYDPAARANRYGFLPSAGDPVVVFEACPGTPPQYNGGFIAAEPVCARLSVESGGETHGGWLSLGAGNRCAL